MWAATPDVQITRKIAELPAIRGPATPYPGRSSPSFCIERRPSANARAVARAYRKHTGNERSLVDQPHRGLFIRAAEDLFML
jgi:hypothetical protein